MGEKREMHIYNNKKWLNIGFRTKQFRLNHGKRLIYVNNLAQGHWWNERIRIDVSETKLKETKKCMYKKSTHQHWT